MGEYIRISAFEALFFTPEGLYPAESLQYNDLTGEYYILESDYNKLINR